MKANSRTADLLTRLVTGVFVLALTVIPALGQESCSGNSHWDIPGRVDEKATQSVSEDYYDKQEALPFCGVRDY